MSSFSDIQEISTSDTLKQLVLKCNANFDIIKNSAGPRGKDGEVGETGPRGKRGKSIHFVDYYFDDEASDDHFGVTEAENAIVDLEAEVGDIVMFSNCYYANISSIDEDTGTIHVGGVYQFRGRRGLQGETGEHGAGDMFVGTGTAISFNTQLGYSKLNLLSSGSNTLNVGGSIGVFNSGTQVGTISGTNGLNVSSTGDMNLSSNNNVIVKKNGGGSVNIGNAVRIDAQGNSIGINNNGIELNGTTKFVRDVTIGNDKSIIFENGSSRIFKNLVNSDNTKTKTLEVVNNTGDSTVLSITGTNGLYVGNSNKNLSISTTGKITTTSPIECNGATISVDGTILDTPKFAFSLYPKNMTTPENWAAFDFGLCIKDVVCLGENPPSTMSPSKIYFKFNIILADRVASKYFVIQNPNTDIGKLTMNLAAIISDSTDSPAAMLPESGIAEKSSISKSERIYDLAEDVYAEEFIRESLDILVEDMDLTAEASPVRFDDIREEYSVWRNYYAELLKNMLSVSDASKIKNMSNTFTRLKKSTLEPTANETYTFIMAKPAVPSDLFKWMFKIA